MSANRLKNSWCDLDQSVYSQVSVAYIQTAWRSTLSFLLCHHFLYFRADVCQLVVGPCGEETLLLL